MPAPRPHIGTLREKPLHASLKEWCSEPGDLIEHPVDGYFVDIVRGDLLIEIQTRGFSSMKRKVKTLLDLGHKLRIVFPVAVDKWIVKVDTDGTIVDRRLSPKHGRVNDIFSEMVSFPEHLVNRQLAVEVVLTSQEEYRVHSPGQAWRRKGWVVEERRLLQVIETVLLSSGVDALALLPPGLKEPFTTADIVEAGGGALRGAQQMAFCLRKAGLIGVVGKLGNSVQYQVVR